MLLNDFDYYLPKELIAQNATKNRANSRLLVAGDKIIDTKFNKLTKYLTAGDLLVLNDTKVMQARLYGKKTTGASVEIMLERILVDNCAKAIIKSSKAPKINTKLIISTNISAIVLAKNGYLYTLKFSGADINSILDNYGNTPLPPYIKKSATISDKTRYQSVFAKHLGSVAAPTAGLHFDNKLLAELEKQDINHTFITLHIGLGTFLAVKTNNIKDHKMHNEYFSISQESADKINSTKQHGKRVVAVGTTVVRTLESAIKLCNNHLQEVSGNTNIFIYPGFKFIVVDSLITNFHLPKSSLLMLVSAFYGHNNIKNIYQHAINKKYRFFSYGDAMLIKNKNIIYKNTKNNKIICKYLSNFYSNYKII